jgi:RNA polymerase sigma factor (sigma-70 family)
MAARRDSEALRWLDTLGREGACAQRSDGRLIEHFLARPGATSEAAFEALVRRHGPMVLSLCRGVLRDEQDAADAFQATFLVLARRASKIRDPDRLAAWLGRVARRIALRSRAETAWRAAIERRTPAHDPEAAPAPVDCVALEAASLVRSEVDRLPETDRLLLQLTYWQGKTYEEAADLLSWPIGTVRSRLSRVRERLRGRLTRLGLAPILGVMASAALTQKTPAAQPPEALILRTVRSATRSAGGMKATAESGVVPAAVVAMFDGELTTMATISWKSVAVLMLFGGTVTAGVVSLAVLGPEDRKGKAATPRIAPVAASPTAQLAAGRKEGARSLLTNAGAEEAAGESPRAWAVGATIPGVEYLWSRDTGHTGQASLCLKKTAQRYFPIAQWSQKVDRQGDTPRLKVSAWVKAETASKAVLDAQFLDGDGKGSHAWVTYIGAREANDPPVSHDWKRYEGVVAIPPGTRQIVIAPQIYGPGTVWFDDLDAEYTDDPATDPTRP